MRLQSSALILALALTTAPATFAQDATSAPSQSAWPMVLPAGDIQLKDLVDRAATQLGQNWMTTAESFSGDPSVKLQTRMELRNADELMAATSNLLYQGGFVVICRNPELGIHDVINMMGPRRGEISMFAERVDAEEALALRGTPKSIMCTVRLENINAQTATNALRPFFMSGSSNNSMIVGNMGDQRSVLLSGLAPQVAAAINLLREADVKAEVDATQRRTLSDQLREMSLTMTALRERIAKLEALAGKK